MGAHASNGLECKTLLELVGRTHCKHAHTHNRRIMGTGSLETVADVSLSADGGGIGRPPSVVEGGIPKCEMDALLLGRTRVSAISGEKEREREWMYLSTSIQLEANKSLCRKSWAAT